MKRNSQTVARDALIAAVSEADKAKALMKSPAAYFRAAGIDVPRGHEAEFDALILERHSRALRHASLHAKAGQLSPEATHELVALALPHIGTCLPCHAAAYVVALLIVGVGAGALTELTIDAAPVVGLAEFAGVSTQAAQVFVVTLGSEVAHGAGAVTKAICHWTGAC